MYTALIQTMIMTVMLMQSGQETVGKVARDGEVFPLEIFNELVNFVA